MLVRDGRPVLGHRRLEDRPLDHGGPRQLLVGCQPVDAAQQHRRSPERDVLHYRFNSQARASAVLAGPCVEGESGYPPPVSLAEGCSLRLDTWDEHRVDLEEVIEEGDNVVAAIHITARGKASGVEVDVRFYAQFRVQDDKVIYIYDHEDRAAAREAVGRSE